MAGNLYQLRSKITLWPGAYVEINGPYDTYGRVLSVISENSPAAIVSFGSLYLIRGLGQEKPGLVEIAAEL